MVPLLVFFLEYAPHASCLDFPFIFLQKLSLKDKTHKNFSEYSTLQAGAWVVSSASKGKQTPQPDTVSDLQGDFLFIMTYEIIIMSCAAFPLFLSVQGNTMHTFKQNSSSHWSVCWGFLLLFWLSDVSCHS